MNVDRQRASFRMVRRGFDPAEVTDQLDQLDHELAALVVDRDDARERADRAERVLAETREDAAGTSAELEEARSAVLRLTAQVDELGTLPDSVDGMSGRLQQMMRAAQEEVNEMRTRATASVTQILTMAQAEASELAERSARERQKYETEQDAARQELQAVLRDGEARIEQLREESDGRRARLDSELAEHRRDAEEALAREMEEQRAASLAAITAAGQRHVAEAQRVREAAEGNARVRLQQAEAEVARIREAGREEVTAAHRELDQLRLLRQQISEQLTAVRALLDWTLPQLPPHAPDGQRPDGQRPGGNGHPAAGPTPSPAPPEQVRGGNGPVPEQRPAQPAPGRATPATSSAPA